MEDPLGSLWVFHMLGFISFKERTNVLALNKDWKKLSETEEWWYFQCLYASYEFRLYCPERIPGCGDWRDYFEELWAVRKIWKGEPAEIGPALEDHRIQVYVRFKPLDPNTTRTRFLADAQDPTEDTKVMLPLHQRISLIRAGSNDPNMSTKDAIKILKRQGDWWGGRDFSGEGNEESNHDPEEDDVESKTETQKFRFQVHTMDESTGEVIMACPNIGLREFQFNGILKQDVNQQLVYDKIGHRLVFDVLNGWNGTLFAYGQTGSGKTFTMFGPSDRSAIGDDPRDQGLVPRICGQILQAIHHRRQTQNIDAHLHMSYVEVYGDRVFDLLKRGESVSHSKVSAQRFVLQGEAKVEVQTEQDVQKLLSRGEAQKSKSATEMNERSTRAHSLLVLTIKQRHQDTEILSKLFLADLGGSERLSKSKAVGQQLVETVNINLGLLSLKKVIAALNDQARHIPYKDSKLTMLLSEGLGGSSRTKVVVCASMDQHHSAETLQTLRFGEECSLIRTKHGRNVVPLVSLIKQLDTQIKNLEETIKQKERWETVEIHRQDHLMEKGTFEETLNRKGGEVIRTTKLVGAEKEHLQLEQLHEKRRQLLGFANN